MYRHLPRPPRPHQLSFAPQAWRVVGAMETETFKKLRAALERLAQEPLKEAPGDDGEPPLRLAQLDTWQVLYTWEPRERLLLVYDLARLPAEQHPEK
jgi:hypothetical protein